MNNYLGSGKVSNCVFYGNTASRGGGMHNYSNKSIFTSCTITGNTASSYGGGAEANGK